MDGINPQQFRYDDLPAEVRLIVLNHLFDDYCQSLPKLRPTNKITLMYPRTSKMVAVYLQHQLDFEKLAVSHKFFSEAATAYARSRTIRIVCIRDIFIQDRLSINTGNRDTGTIVGKTKHTILSEALHITLQNVISPVSPKILLRPPHWASQLRSLTVFVTDIWWWSECDSTGDQLQEVETSTTRVITYEQLDDLMKSKQFPHGTSKFRYANPGRPDIP